MQDCSISSANALEILQSCTKPAINMVVVGSLAFLPAASVSAAESGVKRFCLGGVTALQRPCCPLWLRWRRTCPGWLGWQTHKTHLKCLLRCFSHNYDVQAVLFTSAYLHTVKYVFVSVKSFVEKDGDRANIKKKFKKINFLKGFCFKFSCFILWFSMMISKHLCR